MADAIFFVGPLLNKLQVVAMTEGKALAVVGKEIERLREKLMWLHARVHETELRNRTDGNQEICVLACQMREVAFAAEDTIDHFSLEADLSRFGHDWRRAAAMFVANFCMQIRFRYILSRKIKSLNARIEDIIDNNTKFSSNNASASAITWRPSRTIPLVRNNWEEEDERRMKKGRKKEKEGRKKEDERRTKEEELIKLLNEEPNNEEPNNRVIYVVGESGIGKRYLVRKAYEDPTIKNNFAVRIWENFPPDTSNIADQIEKKLEQEQNKLVYGGKDLDKVKYLVVVDCPMGSATLGETIEKKLPKDGKIVLTTTSIPPDKNVGINSIKLKQLDKRKSQTLFNFATGFGGVRQTNYKTKNIKKIRDRLEEITNQLPLVVVILAKFMRTMNFNKWEGAFDYIKNNKQDDPLETIVYTGIDDLPDELKSCLLYTTGFPERSTIPTQKLVRLWMAEGFLTQQSGVELGQRYLKELIFRGLVQLVKKEGDVVKVVAIHERVHQLFRSEAQRTTFMVTHYGGFATVPASSRRLALNSKKLPGKKLLVLTKLRTVLSHVHDDQHIHAEGPQDFKEGFHQLLKHSSFLRVISLEGINIGEKLPSQIGNMLHLQYLGVRCPTLKTVPKSIGKLKKLQTMDVRDTKVKKLPTSFWKIETLCHVLGEDVLHFPDSASKLKTAHAITVLPMQTKDETQDHEGEATQLEDDSDDYEEEENEEDDDDGEEYDEDDDDEEEYVSVPVPSNPDASIEQSEGVGSREGAEDDNHMGQGIEVSGKPKRRPKPNTKYHGDEWTK